MVIFHSFLYVDQRVSQKCSWEANQSMNVDGGDPSSPSALQVEAGMSRDSDSANLLGKL